MSPNVQPASAALTKDEAEAIIRPKAFDTGPLLVNLNALQSLRFATAKRSMVEVTTSQKKEMFLRTLSRGFINRLQKLLRRNVRQAISRRQRTRVRTGVRFSTCPKFIIHAVYLAIAVAVVGSRPRRTRTDRFGFASGAAAALYLNQRVA